MLDKYLLYSLLYTESPLSFFDFIQALYEIPKRKVDLSLSKSEKKKVRVLFNDFFKENGLDAVPLQCVRDCYVHRISLVGDLYKSLSELSVRSVMTYVRYFELEVTEEVIKQKKECAKEYLRRVCDVFGYVSTEKYDSSGRFNPYR